MNIIELTEKLHSSGIKKQSYSFDKEYPNEAMCLNSRYGTWDVYYSERGEKSNLKRFASEDQACQYMYNILMEKSEN